MYKIVKSPRAWWPVEFPGVTEDGETVINRFEMRFRILDEDEQALVEKDFADMSSVVAGDDFVPSRFSADCVLRIAEDWRGIVADDGTEAGASLPFSTENVQQLCRVPNVFVAILAAYRECRAGGRRGN